MEDGGNHEQDDDDRHPYAPNVFDRHPISPPIP
jgi:hypothetical protein